MKKIGVIVFISLLLFGCSENVSDNPTKNEASINVQSNKSSILEEGFWKGSLYIDSVNFIPFLIKSHRDSVYFINGKEKIGAKIIEEGAAYLIDMPIFDSEFVFEVENSNLIGKWKNKAKGAAYEMDFNAEFVGTERIRFNKRENLITNSSRIDGKWETKFSPNSPDEYKAIGLFEEGNEYVSGTFLTETGDYRFLEGVVNNDSLVLSCFDGAHAFLFEASLKNDTLQGVFYSGTHHKESWMAVKNEGFELSNPDSLTRLKIGEELVFNLPSVNKGETIQYPSVDYEGKVVIIQVMGSWCPNCMDETALFTEFYNAYNEQGLEVIAIAFEKPEDLDGKIERVKGLKEYFGANYDYAIGGKASKIEAQKVLPALDRILSFPTAIFIDKTGQVRKVHTGFYGPGTGIYYVNYVSSTKKFIEKLLNE